MAEKSTAFGNVEWHSIDTLLLDMDGTLLDLAFDNYFWLELVPSAFAQVHGMERERAHETVRQHYESVSGKLAWYCVDHWTAELGLEIRALKWRHRRLIAYLPGVVAFLRAARRAGKSLRLVTNAHPETLAVKIHQTRLDTLVDGTVSAHDYGAAKEDPVFWQRLSQFEPFNPERSVLVEDSLAVTATARSFGLPNTLTIRRPDSRLPARDVGEACAVDGLGDLLGEIA